MNPYSAGRKDDYRVAMGRLLVLYTQADRLIMEICAERIAEAPDERAALALAKQVGDESRHVSIQQGWMKDFGTDPRPVIGPEQEAAIRGHFRGLPWLDFLADMYLCVEALGSEAVEQVVPLADPGTRESLHIPLSDEVDHVAFGIGRLREELARLPEAQWRPFIEALPARIGRLADTLHGFGFPVAPMFEAVGVNYERLCQTLCRRRDELLAKLADDLVAAA
jgi:hypothetical protein